MNGKGIKTRDINTIKVKGSSTPENVIILVTSLFILAFVAFVVYRIRIAPKTNIVINCAPSQCATNIYSGTKKCPDNGSVISIDPETEVCNSPFTCEDPKTPYALLSDGSTSLDGVCDDGVTCRCLQRPRCPYYVTSFFRATNGNPYQSIDNQRISFRQINTYTDLAGAHHTTKPLEYIDPATEFCSIPIDWFNKQRVWPSKCISGTIAFVPEDPEAFSASSTDTTPVACVLGSPNTCPVDSVAFWNNRVNRLSCL